MSNWLSRARDALTDCNAEALGNMIWSLAALGYVPDKMWLRAFAGMAGYKVR